ncbi:4-azaleucine resistance transporter AzlC [Tamaricihabitans halophyticus]|uniref:4-azaleucine resistance transporter AzlC n=1 Tax=Tamaricihabitans halophyticus TaxID=1262583 RepID=A0A4R2QDK2_9PSEU|nr:AzlC family ABC transporter permease [Tamaricihabitans halophyticus]TCP46318.1 4-azaleucine resistance transporter AzlC [Tamaricihabitans halophyticus]
MRSLWKTLDRALLRDIALVNLAIGVVGLSFGAIATSSGFPLWVPMLMSLVILSGAAQFTLVGVLAAGGGPVAGVLAGLVVGARHLPFGFAVGGLLGPRRWQRLVGSHLMIDEVVAFALAQSDPRRARAAYWACGVALIICWNIGTLIGALAANIVPDTDAFGLDAAFPAVLLALVLPSLREAGPLRAALLGGAVALATAPLLPEGVPVLLALVGLLVVGKLRTGESEVRT